MQGSIFLVAVLYLPTEAQRIEGKRKEMLVSPQWVLADDARSASNKAALLAAKANADADPDRLEVLVTNPF